MYGNLEQEIYRKAVNKNGGLVRLTVLFIFININITILSDYSARCLPI